MTMRMNTSATLVEFATGDHAGVALRATSGHRITIATANSTHHLAYDLDRRQAQGLHIALSLALGLGNPQLHDSDPKEADRG